MPELPDVEVYRSVLNAKPLNRRISDAGVYSTRVVEGLTEDDLRNRLAGLKISCSMRHGEYRRMNTGADAWLAIQQFAVDREIRFAKLHAAFMGGFQPLRFLVWAPDARDPENWHHEAPMEIHNLSMILSLGGHH